MVKKEFYEKFFYTKCSCTLTVRKMRHDKKAVVTNARCHKCKSHINAGWVDSLIIDVEGAE